MIDFLLSPGNPANIWVIIVLIGLVTYFTRIAGHVVLARFKNLNYRVVAGLEAVPSAVLITLVLPPLLNNGPLEIIAMIAALVVSFRLNAIGVMTIGMGIVVVGRALGF